VRFRFTSLSGIYPGAVFFFFFSPGSASFASGSIRESLSTYRSPSPLVPLPVFTISLPAWAFSFNPLSDASLLGSFFSLSSTTRLSFGRGLRRLQQNENPFFFPSFFTSFFLTKRLGAIGNRIFPPPSCMTPYVTGFSSITTARPESFPPPVTHLPSRAHHAVLVWGPPCSSSLSKREDPSLQDIYFSRFYLPFYLFSFAIRRRYFPYDLTLASGASLFKPSPIRTFPLFLSVCRELW